MRKIILLFLIGFCSIISYSMEFKATRFASRVLTEYGWTSWVESKSNELIIMKDNKITIYTPNVQRYTLYSISEVYKDSDGDDVLSGKFYDQDGDKGIIETIYRVKYGVFQLYIRFLNAELVYDIKLIKE